MGTATLGQRDLRMSGTATSLEPPSKAVVGLSLAQQTAFVSALFASPP